MSNLFKYSFQLLLASLVLVSCVKDDIEQSNDSVEKLRVYQDEEIFAVNGMVAGDECILLVYTGTGDSCFFKLTDNEGVEKWTVNATAKFGIQVSDSRFGGYIQKLISEGDLFTFFVRQEDDNLRLLQIDKSGNPIVDRPGFTDENTNTFKIFGVQLNQMGNYLLYGSISFVLGSENRCYFAEITPGGETIFRSIYTPFGGGEKGFSGLVIQDGKYYLGGFFRTVSQVVLSSIFLLQYSATGEIVSEEFVETPISEISFSLSAFPVGRELIRNSYGSYSYFISPNGSDVDFGKTSIFNFSSQGEFLDSTQIDFTEENYLPGITPFFSAGIILKQDGSHIGLANEDFGRLLQDEAPGNTGTLANYTNPRYSYIYELGSDGQVINYYYPQREVFNYLSCLDITSDGDIVAAGTTLSFGSKPQMSILWLK